MKQAVAYLRVSGKGQAGDDKDGFPRQEKAIRDYAKANNIEIVKIYREPGVSGALKDRPALTDLLVDLKDNPDGVETVIIEKLDRLARDLMVQENILNDMKKQGVSVISTTEGDLLEDDPTRKLIRQVMGAIAEYDKAMTVQKLRVARERKRKQNASGKCEGRKSYQESNPELIARVKKLRRKPRNGKRMPLKKVLEIIQAEGWKTAKDEEFTEATLRNLIYITMKR